MLNPWTSEPKLVESVLTLFFKSTQVVEDTSGSENDPSTSTLVSQLPELAEIAFRCMKERLDWLGR